jgi:hypothetical protein
VYVCFKKLKSDCQEYYLYLFLILGPLSQGITRDLSGPTSIEDIPQQNFFHIVLWKMKDRVPLTLCERSLMRQNSFFMEKKSPINCHFVGRNEGVYSSQKKEIYE